MKAKDIMTTEVITVTPGESVETVARILSRNRISGVPVLDAEGRVVGIVTEKDLIIRAQNLRIPFYVTLFDSIIFLENPQRFNQYLKKLTATRVEEMMTTRVITVDEETPIPEIASIMSKDAINRVPVVRDGRLVGIITRNDVVRSLVK